MEITKDVLLDSSYDIIYNYTNKTKYKTGIYKITIASHFYIGSASAKRGFYYRWHKHVSELKKNIHKNPKFQNCFNKYRKISFDIIEFCSPEDCIKREQYYIDLLKPDININTIVCNSPLGIKQSVETINKRREKLIGRKYTTEHRLAISEGLKNSWKDPNSKMNTPETKEKRRNSHLGKHLTEAAKEKIRQANLGNTKGSIVVYQYSKDKSVFIKEWESSKIAAKELGIGCAHIASCCTGKRKSAYGYYWTHKKLDNYGDNERCSIGRKEYNN